MIQYFNCKDVDDESIYKAFQIGFSDYMIPLQTTKEGFFERFFGPEGNKKEESYIAFDGQKPVGLILGGIKDYEGLKTMRCGTMCIDPEYRGKGISKELFKLHKDKAKKENCKQLFLEVINGNERAINLYTSIGYQKLYFLKYFSCIVNEIKSETKYMSKKLIKRVGYDEILALEAHIRDIHINWQNDFDYIKQINDVVHYGIYEGNKLLGAASIHNKGKIFFIYIKPDYRNCGLATSVLDKALYDLNLTQFNISLPNNANLEGFIRKYGFIQDDITQYEMYQPL